MSFQEHSHNVANQINERMAEQKGIEELPNFRDVAEELMNGVKVVTTHSKGGISVGRFAATVRKCVHLLATNEIGANS